MSKPNPRCESPSLAPPHVEGGDGEEDGEPSSSPPPRNPIVHSVQDISSLSICSL